MAAVTKAKRSPEKKVPAKGTTVRKVAPKAGSASQKAKPEAEKELNSAIKKKAMPVKSSAKPATAKATTETKRTTAKTTAKPAAKLAAATPAKKTATKKTTAPKTTAKKAAATKTTATKKTTAKKVTATKTTVKKATVSEKAVAVKTTPSQPPAPVSAVTEATPAKASPKRKARFTAKEVAQLRNDLIELRSKLSVQVETMRKNALTRHDEVNHEEDGSDAFNRLFTLDRAGGMQSTIQQIDSALRAIDDESYGTCESCNCLIEYARLHALPFVKNCISCQSELERQRSNRPYRQRRMIP